MSAVGWKLRNRIVRIPISVRIAMSWFQMFSLFTLLSRKWPQEILSLFNLSKFASLEIQYFGFECDVSVGYWFVWATKLSLPLIMLIIPLILAFLSRFPAFASFSAVHHSEKAIFAFSFFLNFFYTSILGSVFEPFNCIRQNDGNTYMSANPSQKCSESSWNSKLPAAVFFAVVYLLAFPGISLWMYVSKRQGVRINSSFESLLAILLAPYRKEIQFWEWIKFLHKFAFILVRDVGSLTSDARQTFATVLILGMLCMEMLWTPFARKHTNLVSAL
jgi:hypothetical protein